MKKYINYLFAFVVLSVSVFGSCYEKQILNICSQVKVEEKPLVFPQDIEKFLEKSIDQGQTVSFLFYPNRSGFDYLVQDGSFFLKIGQVKAMAVSLGYKVIRVECVRHMASFRDIEELQAFVEKYFSTPLDFDKAKKNKLHFPTRLCYIKLQKQ